MYIEIAISTEKHAIIQTLYLIKSPLAQNCLIVTDFQSQLYSILADPFKSSFSYFTCTIRSILK